MAKKKTAKLSKALTSQQVADKHGVSVRTVREWSRRGIIPVIRASNGVIRYDSRAVTAAIKAWEKKKALMVAAQKGDPVAQRKLATL